MTPPIVRSASLFAVALCAFLVTRAAAATTVRPEVVATFPHDRAAFTQGLLLHEGKLYESTGLTGRSSIRRVNRSTGVVEKSVSLAPNLFGEGLALVGDRFFQITWQNHVALSYDLDFASIGSFDYTGEGWGLCYDGKRLVMSDGSSRLFFRNPQTFAVEGDVEVRGPTGPVTRLNELECVGPLVFANVWQTDMIVRIDPATGDVLDTIDASGLLSREEAVGVDVLNGIAFDPATGHFLITGKLWPKIFEVRLTFEGEHDAGSDGGTEQEPVPPKDAKARGGCGCSVPVPGGAPSGPLLLAIAGLFWAWRRRSS
jgi:glutaminyl-peptide cyclotransferase